MLQQTRVEAVIPYYHRFLERFPTLAALATAPESDVLTAWSGLGYYSRARNLHRAAKQLALTRIPTTHDELRALPGIGPYTAAAVASIALGLPHPAVDGNVIRVIARLTNDPSEIASPVARRQFAAHAADLLDRKRPGDFNQAMMELGATICTPRNPACEACPVAKFCAARAAGTERELPVKTKKAVTRDLELDLVLLRRAAVHGEDAVFLVGRRSTEKRLAGFRELPERRYFPDLPVLKACDFRHQIVNDRFRIAVWTARLEPGFEIPRPTPCTGEWCPVSGLNNIPLSTVTKKALRNTSLQLFPDAPADVLKN